MHQRSLDKPTQSQLVLPLLEQIKSMGGTAKAKDVSDSLADRLNLSESARNDIVRTADGQTVNLWRRHVRFAKLKAAQMGYLRSETRGAWSLTSEGENGIETVAPAVSVTVITDDAGKPIGAQIELAAAIPTVHTIHLGDARDLGWIGDQEVHLVATSTPYFDLKDYGRDQGQLATLPSYEAFLDALDDVMAECWRVLIPGGKMVLNVGDVLRSRKRHGSHHILPLHADLLVRSRRHGFQALNGLIWNKIGTANYEQGPGGVLGKPGQPNQAIKLEHEHLLVVKRPGPYRQPTPWQQQASAISRTEQDLWYRPIWSDVPGTRATKDHPAPFPVEIPYRLVRMFSFAGDTVLDPFGGRFTTTLAAMKAGRNSVSTEISPQYFESGLAQLQAEASQFANAA